MDILSEKIPISGVTGPVEMIVAYGHPMKVHRINSKDKLNNAFITTHADHEKKRTTSKLPRVAKTPIRPTNSLQTRLLETSGDSIAGTSKPKFSTMKSNKPNTRIETEKLKGSHIPRRKIITTPVRKDNEKLNNSNYYSKKSQHIQRLHVPKLNPDFQQEERLIGSTRPIPTLGQIYRRNNIIIDGDRFYDWFMELDAPVNSLESNPIQQRQTMSSDSTDTTQSVINVEVSKPNFMNGERQQVVFGVKTANVYKTTNDNISEWLTSELDSSNKDNESGYRSMSPHSRGAINIEAKCSDAAVKRSGENYCLTLGKTSEGCELDEGGVVENNTDMVLTEQQTVVISRFDEENEIEPVRNENSVKKIDIALEPIVICKSERSQNLQFPSLTVTDSRDERQAMAPSYVECPSEILQKTTNFEGDGCESPKTLSSIAATDLEIRDDYSSLYTLENMDDCNLDDHTAHASWCPVCRSQSCMTFVKSEETDDATLQTSYCGCRGDKSDTTAMLKDSNNHVHRHKNYCRTCHRTISETHCDSRIYCKKHSRYRRFPSYRYKITRPFDSLRKKLSIRRICRHRWDRVWKKTTARWNNWSKSHSKLGKFRMLQYLQSSIIWEDAHVQTILLVCRETGTHANAMEQRSAGITAYIKWDSASGSSNGGVGISARSIKSRFKQTNLGPSRFPFFYNSKRKSMPLQSMDEASKPIQRFNSCHENQHKNTKAIGFQRIPGKLTADTSVICGYLTTNTDTSPMDVHRQCPCSKNAENSKTQIKRSKNSVICECPVKSDSFSNFHRLKTVDAGTDDMLWRPCNQNQITSPVFSTNVETQLARDESTQLILISNNIEADIMFKPVLRDHSVGSESNNFHFYKPYGINADNKSVAITTDSLRSSRAEDTSNQADKPPKNITQKINFVDRSGSPASSLPKESGFLKQPNSGDTLGSSKKEMLPKSPQSSSTNTGNTIKEMSAKIPQSSSTSTDIPRAKSELARISPPTLQSTGILKSKRDLATETPKPKLTSTDTKITSISSAKMLPASVVTSGSDIRPGQNVQVNVSTITKSNVCRCKDCRVAATGRSHTQINKCTDTPVLGIKDKNIGPCEVKRVSFEQSTSTFSNKTDAKMTEDLSTQALLQQWSLPQHVVEMGTMPITLGKKSTYVFTAVDQKSAYASTSQKKMQSFNMVTSNVNDLKRLSASTNTSYDSQSRSVGMSSPAIPEAQTNKKSTIDTWVQYSHLLDQSDLQQHSIPMARIGNSRLITTRTINDSTLYDFGTEPILNPPSHYKSVAIMTSGPFDEACNTSALDGRPVLLCACAQVGCNMETNTQSDFKSKRHTACSTQIFQSQCNQNFDKGTCSSEDYAPGKTMNRRSAVDKSKERNTDDQLTSLSRLIGHVKSGSHSESGQAITSKILSSNLDANKWIKRCTNNDEKDYQSLIDIEQSTLETLKQASMSIANSNKSSRLPTKVSLKTEPKKMSDALCNSVAIASRAPITTVSDDSLADVLPANSVTQKSLPSTEIKKMADKVTSDEVITKPLKESILQACPDVSDAGTDAIKPNIDSLKSESALTSRCVLPSPSICCLNSEDPVRCIFIYDKPHCAVHKTRIDASVQMTVTEQEDKDSNTNSSENIKEKVDVGVIPCDVPSFDIKAKSNSIIGEVLPPKAYKALYETTKMVIKESRLHPDSNAVPCCPNLENEAAIIRALAIRSAAILTSHCGLCPSDKENNNSATERAEYVYAFNSSTPSPKDSTQTCINCHARLLDMPPYYQSGVMEERVKTQLVDSCRYYSNLLTKRLERVKEKVTKHLAPPAQQCLYFSAIPKLSYTEAFTIKPSGRSELGCQTVRSRTNQQRISRRASCCALSPSVTDICGTEQHRLRAVYYMLAGIEGRIRRLKRNIPS